MNSHQRIPLAGVFIGIGSPIRKSVPVYFRTIALGEGGGWGMNVYANSLK